MVTELNRQEQLKEIKNSEKKYKKQKADTERLRKIKIQIVNQKREKAHLKKNKIETESERKRHKEGLKYQGRFITYFTNIFPLI